MSRQGLFITFEGSEGVGKTTQIKLFSQWLQQQGREVLLTREPGGTELGEAVRELLLSKDYPAMHSDTELLLMFAARAEHIHRVIKPALKAGKVVISDRFTDASFAYQGAGRGLPFSHIAELKQWVQQGLEPQLTFLLDLPVEEGLARARSRAELDRFESQQLAFFEKVREGYLKIARAEPQRVKVIDATLGMEAVAQQVRDEFLAFLAVGEKTLD